MVVNLRRQPFDIYIGRHKTRGTAVPVGERGYFGNLFTLIGPRARDEVLERFEVYFLARLLNDHEFRAAVLGLRGKRLGCYCAPAPCHGHIIARWVDGQCQEVAG